MLGSRRGRTRAYPAVVVLLSFLTLLALVRSASTGCAPRGRGHLKTAFLRGPPRARSPPSPLATPLRAPVRVRAHDGRPEPPPPEEHAEEDAQPAKFFTQAAVFSAVSIASALVVAAGVLLTQQAVLERNGSTPETVQVKVFKDWYTRASQAAKQATRDANVATKNATLQATKFAEKAETTIRDAVPKASGPTLVPASIVERIRGMSIILDSCQQDIYDEVWPGLQTYGPILRGYTNLLNYYLDTAYPVVADIAKDDPVSAGHDALQYEVGRFNQGLSDLEQAVGVKDIRNTERAFAEMSLAFDRYLKAGSLYSGYDPVTSTTVFYDKIPNSQLVYTPITLEQPRIRDEVLVIQGPDKGKVGKVIWLGRNGPDDKEPDRIVSATVKLSPNPLLGLGSGKGVAETKEYPYSWIAVTRTSEQSFSLDLALGALAATFSCALCYPLDFVKARIQGGLPLMPPSGPLGLFDGLSFNLLREVPNQAIYLAGFNFLTRQLCMLPFVDENNPALKFVVMIPAGVAANLLGTPIRTPFEILNRQMQSGAAATEQEAIQNVFYKSPKDKVVKNLQATWFLVCLRGVPFGALQCTFYELFKDKLELVQYGVPLAMMPFVWGALAGALTGILTNPPDVVLGRLSSESASEAEPLAEADGEHAEEPGILQRLTEAAAEISRVEGIGGFFRGAIARALYFAPEACLWFAAYEFLRSALNALTGEP